MIQSSNNPLKLKAIFLARRLVFGDVLVRPDGSPRRQPSRLHEALACKISIFLLVGIFSLSPFAGAGADAQRICRIMPVGDSITEGGATFSSYRYPLWERLFAAGYLVEFVGSRTSESRIGPL
ncbi:MAG: hypothetical protein WCS42_13865, partial [Verrucomicrobiota bacterium]